MVKIAINGFGRIGRSVFKIILNNYPSINVAAINDLVEPKILAHLLKYDSLSGLYSKQIRAKDSGFFVGGSGNEEEIKIFSEKNPEKLPWKKLGIDIVLECAGIFRDLEGAGKHLKAGAKKVIISAPARSEEIPTYLLGVNQENYKTEDNIVSMGSCTTNCLAPVAKVLDGEFKIVKGFMTTVHSYTNDQRILDLPHKDLRRARAAAINIIPTTTGAAKTVEKCLPRLKGKLQGLALRVPTPVVSIVDFVAEVERETTREEINYIFKKASQKQEFQGILGVEDAPLVSSDYKGNSYSAIIDSLSTFAQGNLIKVLAWYDNEYGYSSRLAEFVDYIGKKL